MSRMHFRCLSALLCIGLAVNAFSEGALITVPRIEKKLIEYGWDVPTSEQVRANIRAMEARPFDGIIFKLKGSGNVLEPTAWDEAAYSEDFDHCANIPWEKFTDNFLILWAASDQDWFNDEHWASITHNVSIMAKAGKLARCAGLCFDAEPYGTNPWTYTKMAHKDTKSFEEYMAMARKRGQQFMQAIEKEFPQPHILTFYQLGLFGEFCIPLTPEERLRRLSQHDYALYPAFFNGMLDACSPETRFSDGNENAYYYHDAAAYFEAYHRISQRALHLADPALWIKYETQVQVGQALYVDQYYGLRAVKVLGNYLTPEEQPKWFEHNAYWALYTSDEYVWCYSERMNWWNASELPKGSEEALVSARQKIKDGAPLGFDIQPFVQAGLKREKGETP